MRSVVLWLAIAMACHAAGISADTTQMASHLAKYRAFKTYRLQGAEFEAVQKEFLAWVDVRVRRDETVTTVFRIAGTSAAAMRMQAIANTRSPSCKGIDLKAGLQPILDEPKQ